MCHVLGVKVSAYYTWRTRQESRREREDRRLLVHIRSVHAESRQSYGSPRIYRELKDRGIEVGEHRVARLMRQHQIRPRQAKRFRATTDSRHSLPVAENTLERQFAVDRPNAVWAADITYIWTSEGWLYLAVVMDLFSRRIVGWSMQQTLGRPLVLEAMRMALSSRRPAHGLLHHSDRGSQYASKDYQALLASYGIRCSMSRRRDCWDNAPVESFFSTLKRELIHYRRYATRKEAQQDIFEYIEVWYNRKRRHSTLGYLSPCEYEVRTAVQHHPLAA